MVEFVTFQRYVTEEYELPILAFMGEYQFLSNFYPVKVEYEGKIYPSVEHAYQAAKSLDDAVREQIRNLPTPGQAKRAGKKVDLRKDWQLVNISIMEKLLRQKFSNPELKERLLKTGKRELVEGNTWGDTFWGVCKGVGENHLGKLLMQIRDDYATGQDSRPTEERLSDSV